MNKKGWIIGLSFLVLLFAVTATAIVINELVKFYGKNRQFYSIDLPSKHNNYSKRLKSDTDTNADDDVKDGTLKDSPSQEPSPKKEPESESKREPEKLVLNKVDKEKKKTVPPKEVSGTKNQQKPVNSSKTGRASDEKFNSWGEYISDEERRYRTMVVDKLKVKTVVIDHLSPGNGVSQEFFKVAYRTKMIPSRILEELVESREFRELIPAKYLKRERALLDIRKGIYIKLEKRSLENLLDTWSRGELTPIQKAWAVGAEE